MQGRGGRRDLIDLGRGESVCGDRTGRGVVVHECARDFHPQLDVSTVGDQLESRGAQELVRVVPVLAAADDHSGRLCVLEVAVVSTQRGEQSVISLSRHRQDVQRPSGA